ncbi:hypothetical protein BGX23_007937 [Mortierella sp. AD031]|nr:hypothetical protein BGX23_007937 [Mortierella sp. AD031]
MPDGFDTFFSIPELAAELCPYLMAADFLNLMLTCRQMSIICRPLFWNTLFVRDDECATRFITSPQGLESFSRNIDSVRSLQTRGIFLNYYTVGLAEYLRIASSNTGPQSGPSTSTRPPPNWVPCNAIEESKDAPPLPPFTKLKLLRASMLYGDMEGWEHDDSRAVLRAAPLSFQTFWIMQLNPTLTNVFLHGLDFDHKVVARCMARALAGLKHLKHLVARAAHAQKILLQDVDVIFRSLPQSIVSCRLLMDASDINIWKPGSFLTPNKGDKDMDEGRLVLRTEPLANLRDLQLPDMYRGYQSSQICLFLEHCPQLTTWHVSSIAQKTDATAITRVIQTNCKELKRLYVRMPYSNYKGEFVMSVMEAMAPHRLEQLTFMGYHDEWPVRMALSIQRHCQVLQEIRLQGCHHLMSSTIQAILTSCLALRRFEVAGSYPTRIAISLEDAAAAKEWVCKDIRHLVIYVQIPSAYTDTQQPQWNFLERLYRHIGSLRELEFLNLRGAAVNVDVSNGKEEEVSYERLAFPGLLSLGDMSTGEPGYLSLLEGLKRLKTLQGSVGLEHARSQEPIGQAEVEWVHDNWPSLRLAEFLLQSHSSALERYPHLKWLQQKKPDLKFSKPVVPSSG